MRSVYDPPFLAFSNPDCNAHLCLGAGNYSLTEQQEVFILDAGMSLSILERGHSEMVRMTWQHDDAGKLEKRMTEIAVQIVLTSEIQHRKAAVRQYQWRVERKAGLEQEARKCKLEAERAARERQERLEQARIDRLLRDAMAFQRAGDIRKYVEAIRLTQSRNGVPLTEDKEQWSRWEPVKADRIDPAIKATFLALIQDEDGTVPER